MEIMVGLVCGVGVMFDGSEVCEGGVEGERV